MTNLRNYVNLSQVAIPTTKIGELDFAPLGAGSGMIGLPGGFHATVTIRPRCRLYSDSSPSREFQGSGI
jgi:penicillin V acylase-like amidase (Ntn superfamily)